MLNTNTGGIKLNPYRQSDKENGMTQRREVKTGDKPRQTVRRSADYKARLSAASAMLAEKMEEKRNAWVSK